MPQPQPTRSLARFPWWLLAIALIGIVLLWSAITDAAYAQIFATLARGVGTTLWVTMVAFTLATLLGLVVALARTATNPVLRQVATFYIEVIRGIPILVALFYVAFVGAPAMVGAANWVLEPFGASITVRQFDFAWRAIVALTVCYSAFIAEIFRAGIEAVDRGQIEAARALGLSRWNTFRFVTAPQALRTILPPLGNDFVSMVKDSALVSALGVQDITQLGKVYASGTFLFFETYNVVAFLYLAMTISLSLLIRLLEQRLNRRRF
ncbi:amino acid ABC transporter permease [Devosia sp. RR2S18]|uniref:amino acid ABC transporter permease n=1 Tax=Devosia rhizosphaerae TaxID=3049774 RepID=UPI002540FEB6|nr:amino acid ABC transporter permease [Devosia sp. RR2S18]WIJ25044.1 amino acid ABC transporter permease [Devosia sp. RR2S18]